MRKIRLARHTIQAVTVAMLVFASNATLLAEWNYQEWFAVEQLVQSGPMNQLIAWLNENGADVRMPDELDQEGENTHLILYALRSGDMRRVQLFLDRGVTLDTSVSRWSGDVIEELAALGTPEADDLIRRYGTPEQLTALAGQLYVQLVADYESPDAAHIQRLIDEWGVEIPVDYKTTWWSVTRDRDLRELVIRANPAVLDSDPVQLYLDQHASSAGGRGFWRHDYEALPLISSFLEDSRDFFRYYGLAAFDGDLNTSWVEGRDGAGEGDSVLFRAQEPDDTDGGVTVSIFPGYGDRRFFSRNNRIRRGTLVFYVNNQLDSRVPPGGEWFVDPISVEFEAPDEFDWVRVPIPGEYTEDPLSSTYIIRLIIEEVYPGSDWNDTCIAEVVVHATGAGPASP